MRYAKMLALAAVAAGALMAFIGASTASATVLCSTTADPCPKTQDWPVGTILDFSIPAGQSANLVETSAPGGEGKTLDTCTGSTVRGKITKTGGGTGATETVTGLVENFKTENGTEDPGLSWSGCTFPTKTLKNAGLEVHKIAGTSNGTVTSDGLFEVTINTVFFGSCIYGVKSGGSIGDITEGIYTKTPEKPTDETAIFHANALAEKLSGSNIACPATSVWTATYVLTTPEGTTLSVSSSSS